MKKTYIALALLTAMTGAAHAQSNVTVYGVVDMALQNENNGGAAGSKTALDSGMQSGSRLGFKGTEDLGNGLKANFKLEMGVNADTGASSQGGLAFGRQAYVGLSGDFGSVNFGRQYAPIFIAVDTIDPFDAGIISGQAGSGTSSSGILGLFNTPFRTNNTVNYTTNNLSGFTGSLAYSFGEVAGDTSKSRQIGVSGTYAGGPLVAVIAYHSANDAASNATKNTFVGATYDFGAVKAAAAYGKTTTDDNSFDTKEWMLGATVPVSANDAIIGTYVRSKNNLAVTAGNSDSFAIGFTHAMSKRTNLYTSFSRTSNDANANAGGLAAGNGLTDRMVNVGIRHMF